MRVLKVVFEINNNKSLVNDFLCDCIERITLDDSTYLIAEEYFYAVINNYSELNYTILSIEDIKA
jgi:hypothetical protein